MPSLEISSIPTLFFQIGPVKDYIKMLCENADLKLLVFAHYHIMMDSISELLSDLSIKFIRIDGKTPHQDRPVSHTFCSLSYILGGCPFNGPLSGTKYPTRAASPIQNASTPKSSLPFSKHRSCALLCAGFSRTLHRVSYFVYF